MEEPHIWVVAVTHRDAGIPRIIKNFERQLHPNKKLLIVENGEAVGGCARAGVTPDHVVTSKPHVSHARNAGIDFVRENGGGWLAMMDDDDYYGPLYLSEHAAFIKQGIAEVYGKHRHFVGYVQHGMYLYAERHQLKPASWLHGATLCFRAEHAVPYDIVDSGEEVLWAAKMQRLGFRLFATTIHHYAYLRGPSHFHTWKAEVAEAHATGQVNDWFYSFGTVDTDVIDKRVKWEDHARKRGGLRYDLVWGEYDEEEPVCRNIDQKAG